MAKSVIIYSTPTCTYCRAAKELFAKHNVQYTEHNVATDIAERQAMIEKSGQMGVPVIDIDGQVMVGYNKATLEKLLGV